MPPLDTVAARLNLASLRPEIAAVVLEPERARDIGHRLWHLATKVTAACEAAFLSLTDASSV